MCVSVGKGGGNVREKCSTHKANVPTHIYLFSNPIYHILFDSQNNRNSNEKLPRSSELFSIINLFPVGESPCGALVSSGIGCALQMVEHDIHTLK